MRPPANSPRRPLALLKRITQRAPGHVHGSARGLRGDRVGTEGRHAPPPRGQDGDQRRPLRQEPSYDACTAALAEACQEVGIVGASVVHAAMTTRTDDSAMKNGRIFGRTSPHRGERRDRWRRGTLSQGPGSPGSRRPPSRRPRSPPNRW